MAAMLDMEVFISDSKQVSFVIYMIYVYTERKEKGFIGKETNAESVMMLHRRMIFFWGKPAKSMNCKLKSVLGKGLTGKRK